jgi:acetaldehyde dehydrogenase (acetylating)
MSFRFCAAGVLALAGLFSLSCGGIVDPSQNTVEAISGTVQPGSARAHWFSAPKTGEIAVKLLTLTPASIGFIGVEWVQGANDQTCNGNPLQVNQFATPNSTAISGQIVSGPYCIIIFDSVGLTQPATYTGSISHP